MSAKLISIIGPPAVGKTTLAEWLAARLPAELIREDYAGNPFLAGSYQGRSDAMLPGQLYFLMSRAKQLSLSSWSQEGLFVSDYGFCQDRVFASARLSKDDLGLYRRIAGRIEGLIKPPDVLVHLDACEETLLERIAARGRNFEKSMTTEFLRTMRKAYNEAQTEQNCPVISIDCDEMNILDEGERESILCEITNRLASTDGSC